MEPMGTLAERSVDILNRFNISLTLVYIAVELSNAFDQILYNFN